MKILQYVFLLFFIAPATLFSQDKFDFYISNTGNDSFPGTSHLLPKKSIADVAPLLKVYSGTAKEVKVALKSGDVWKENLITSYPIELSTYNENADIQDFAILDGAKEFGTGWLRDSGTSNTFKQAIPYTGFVGYGINGIGTYSFIYVFEIDRLLEKTAPFTARRMLKFVATKADVDKFPGSFTIPINTNENPMPVYIHTSDGSSPNDNVKYRYEVSVRDWAVNSTYQENSRFENLWVRGFGAGNGILPGGANSYYNKVIFGPGAAIHHLVVRGGVINHSLFLPGPRNTNGYGVVFYDVEGFGRHCSIKNSMFFDVRTPLYAHTSMGTNFGAVEMDNVVGFADSAERDAFMYTSNTDSVILNNVYADGYLSGYNFASAKYASITNCWFKDVTFGLGYSFKNPVISTIKNIFIKTKGSDYVSGVILQDNVSVTISNSIIHLNSDSKTIGNNVGAFVSGAGGPAKIVAKGNIFICDIDPITSVAVAGTNTIDGIATSKDVWNNNVYILLRGSKMLWNVNNGSSIINIQNFKDWKALSGQDKNSLFYDLRYDSRGLKAIFVDPDKGNYDLANTPEGRQIAALQAGMITPLTCFLQKPTYEEAADLIKNNKDISINACRNPCLQNTLRVNNTFSVSAINNKQIKLQWNISEQQNIDHYEIQRSAELFGFKKISSQPISTDSIYAFIDNVPAGTTYRYRILVIAKAGDQCYSETRTLKLNDNRLFSIYPNPSSGKILVSMNGYVGVTNFSVTNSMGQIVMEVKDLSVYRSFELNLAKNPRGIYFLKMQASNGIAVQKFVLQ